jgi:Peptidase M15
MRLRSPSRVNPNCGLCYEDHDVRISTLRGVLGCTVVLAIVLPSRGLDAERAVFRSTSHTVSLFALPGEPIAFDLASYAGLPVRALPQVRFVADPHLQVTLQNNRFQVTAPSDPGIYGVLFQEPTPARSTPPLPYRMQVVVMRSVGEARNGVLNGYPVGIFPSSGEGERWRFERPRGFVEITPSNRNIPLSDHFRLGDLDCKLERPFPHYAVIHTSLLVKLEGLVDVLNQRGLPGEDMKILSGFRTPDYNREIGNETIYSRHIAGDAADIFLDRNHDGRMDDLNRDGRVNRRDARLLLSIVDAMDESPEYGVLVGGASAYRANASHGPFLHVDARGYPARW